MSLFIDNLKYLRWFLDHIDELRPLLELPSKLQDANTPMERWELLHEAMQLLLDVFGTFPAATQEQISPRQLAEIQQLVETKAVPWDKLMALLPLLVELIRLLQGGCSGE